ncbi:solute carrier family 41 member 1 [Trichinella spiralis]|uniref:solute carrier family 41 member 1 n=1 Tax=Trichinella spiralis TaxID=6334 RepID=UPI0001EFCDCD|nr:solute carrier family 41 member 1 [Trichinella spiralis]
MVPFIDTAACGTTETVDDVELDEIVFRSGSSKVEPLSTTNEEACNEAQLIDRINANTENNCVFNSIDVYLLGKHVGGILEYVYENNETYPMKFQKQGILEILFSICCVFNCNKLLSLVKGNCTAEGEGGSCSSKTKVVSESEDPSDEQPLLMGSPNDAVEMKLDEKCDCNGYNTPPVGKLSDANEVKNKLETGKTMAVQMFLPFLIAGLGTVGAGLVLDYVQHWMVFTKIPEMFILVPALLGLKGNLEMTLASRLSTMANMGLLDNQSERSALLVANLCLIETQANVISLFASFLAILLRWITNGEKLMLKSLNSTVRAKTKNIRNSFTMNSLCEISLVMISVILLCRYFGINPDNVATPIAASLGDLVTLTMLAYIGSFYLLIIGRPTIVCTLIIFGLIALLPVCFLGSWKNKDTKEVVLNGFSPIICSMLISSIICALCLFSGSGFILGRSVTQFKGIAVFQPIINGIGGNLVAIQASRISTYLHKNEKLGKVASYLRGRQAANPFWVTAHHCRMGAGVVRRSRTCVLCLDHQLSECGPYDAYVQVFILLYFCFVGVHMLWKWKMNPDDIAIPYLTALGDFLGTLLLYICFYIMSSLGDHDADRTNSHSPAASVWQQIAPDALVKSAACCDWQWIYSTVAVTSRRCRPFRRCRSRLASYHLDILPLSRRISSASV